MWTGWFGLGRLAPQLPRVEAHAVERLRLLAEAVGVGVGEDVDAVAAVDHAALAARVARQPRVPARVHLAREHGLARREARAAPVSRMKSVSEVRRDEPRAGLIMWYSVNLGT